MRAETETRITAWQTRSVEDGYAGIHALGDASFSGAIAASGTWLFMLDGRPIGLFGESIETIAEGTPTAYVAPHPALPLLFTMRERGGETTARYYTDDTPLADTAETLSSSGFTGYVELSENVLSGEYYLVFHRGRSVQVAFVGESGRLLAGDEALSRANEEVGIYEVTAVALEELDLPEPPKGSTETGSPPPGSPSTDEERPNGASASVAEPTDANADGPGGPIGASAPPRPEEGEPSATTETRARMDSVGTTDTTVTRSRISVDDGEAIDDGREGDDRTDDRPVRGGRAGRSVDPADR